MENLNLTLTQEFITNIENVYEDIVVTFDFRDKIDNDEYVTYNVDYDGSRLFVICISYIIFTSGKINLDYTLVTDIESDSFQTQDIKEFQRRVIDYIKEIV